MDTKSISMATAQVAGDRLRPGIVVSLLDTGEILVDVKAKKRAKRILCDFLETTEAPMVALSPGDTVLVVLPGSLDEKGCVLGRVGRYVSPNSAEGDLKSIVIEATRDLTLKCGDSSIKLRNDGKLLVKATDVVSHAKRTNRIKGGSVQIN